MSVVYIVLPELRSATSTCDWSVIASENAQQSSGTYKIVTAPLAQGDQFSPDFA